jgi:hypothetical protein
LSLDYNPNGLVNGLEITAAVKATNKFNLSTLYKPIVSTVPKPNVGNRALKAPIDITLLKRQNSFTAY